MLISLFCDLLILYFIIISIDIILFSIRCFHKKKLHNCLTISKNIHYLCSILSSIMIVALFLNLLDFDGALWWFYIIFGIAVLISIPLMLVVVFWKVTWSNETIHYRNPLCHWRTYNIEDIRIINRNQYTTIMYQDKKITDYNFMFLDIWDVREFEIFLKTRSK